MKLLVQVIILIKDVIPREMRLTAGIHYIDVDTPDRMSMEPMVKIVNEALARAGK